MSGPAVIRYLLANAAAVTAVVASSRIQAGELPLNTVLPAIGVKSISSNRAFRGVRVGTTHVWEERVQVTAMAEDVENVSNGYTTARNLIPLIVAACPSQRGTINGVAVISITPEGAGPDLETADLDLATSSVDFIVCFST